MWQGSHKKNRRGYGARNKNSRTLVPPSSIARHRLKIRALYVAVVCIVLALFVAGVSWLTFSSVLSVTNVRIIGTRDARVLAAITIVLDRESQTPLWYLFSRNSFPLYPARSARTAILATFPTIDSVMVSRQLFARSITFSIHERTPYARWCTSANTTKDNPAYKGGMNGVVAITTVFVPTCYIFDARGFIYRKDTTVIVPAVDFVFYGGVIFVDGKVVGNSISPLYFNSVSIFLKELQDTNLTITKVIFKGKDAEVVLASGASIKVALDSNLKKTIQNLKTVLLNDGLQTKINTILYIDMRFGNKVYFKYKR